MKPFKTLNAIFIALAFMAINLPANAQTETASPPAAPANLADTMKLMSSKLKAITVQTLDASKNAQSAVLADEFVAAVAIARTFTPKTITDLPLAQQPKQKAIFLQMIDGASALGVKLAAAFRANDNAAASQLLNQMVDAKKQGHDAFKPPHE